MKVYTPDNAELMDVRSIERSGSTLVIRGKIMGAMPMTAVIFPAEARKGIRLLGLRTMLFLPVFLLLDLGRGKRRREGRT